MAIPVPAPAAVGTPLYQLLDDVPGATLVSRKAPSRTMPVAGRSCLAAERTSAAAGIGR
jgi:hypothetical protein